MTDPNRKQAILGAAEKIMAQKGMCATIAEIAAHAGVPDSMIYRYFKNKEDLLFSVAEERLRQGQQAVSEHLSGLVDPIDRLRKVIWFSLYYNENHRDFSRLILFECRSNRNFIQHPAFGHVRRSLGLMRGILEDGVQNSIFRNELQVPVVRDAIFGLLDIQCIQRLTLEPGAPLDDEVEKIMDLVLPMLTGAEADDQNPADKSQRILGAAEEVFALRGFEYARIQEIARGAGVAEGTVYEYFENKEDLLLSTLKHRLVDHLERLDQLFEVKSPLRKLRRFIRYHFSTYLEQTSFVKNFLLHGLFNQRFYASPVYPVFKQYIGLLGQILQEGKLQGVFRSQVDDQVFENLFIGAFMLITLRWVFIGEAPVINQLREIDQVVDLLTRAVVKE